MAWQSLIDILQENAADREREASTPPVACPVDGEPFDEDFHCRFCGYEPDGLIG